jgi:2-methylcitrate dehydratase PrpD
MNDDPETSLHPQATRRLADFSSSLRFADLPADVVEHLKLLVLDGLGCCLYGAGLPWTQTLISMIEEQGGAAQASVFGTNLRTSVSNAALINGTAGHAFELDDIHRGAILHPNSLCPPVVLGLAEWRGDRTGADALTAIAAGYEVGTRIGLAATQALFFRGFHPQGTTGVFAGAAAAARAIDLDANDTQHALGIAGSQAAGLMAAQAGAMVKRMNAGRAAQSGVYGALLAERGFTGITDVLEAPFGGFLSAMSAEPDPARLTDGLGRHQPGCLRARDS